MTKKLILLSIVPLFFFSNCATLFTGTKDKITFNTTPQGAAIFINGIEQCKTPCTIDVKRSFFNTLTEFKLDGYETQIISLSKEFNVVSILNLGDIFGWAIDFVSGAVFKYDKKSYEITLNSIYKTTSIYPYMINIDTNKKIAELYIMVK